MIYLQLCLSQPSRDLGEVMVLCFGKLQLISFDSKVTLSGTCASRAIDQAVAWKIEMERRGQCSHLSEADVVIDLATTLA